VGLRCGQCLFLYLKTSPLCIPWRDSIPRRYHYIGRPRQGNPGHIVEINFLNEFIFKLFALDALLRPKKFPPLSICFFVAILLLHNHHRGNMRQPDMASVLGQMSSHLQAGAGCSGTPYRNIKTHNCMRCRAFAG
jgi:hypothetical protein